MKLMFLSAAACGVALAMSGSALAAPAAAAAPAAKSAPATKTAAAPATKITPHGAATGHTDGSANAVGKKGSAVAWQHGHSRSAVFTSPLDAHGHAQQDSGAHAQGNKPAGKTKAGAHATADAHAYVNKDGNPQADATAHAKAGGKVGGKNGPAVNVATGKGKVGATAIGGAKPTATAYARYSKELTMAKAYAGGKAATAKGGHTTITHPKPGITVAVSYTPHTYSVGVSLAHRAEAFSKIAVSGQTFTGKSVFAAAQAAAYAFAAAGYNYAQSYADAGADGYGHSHSSDSEAHAYASASAIVYHDGAVVITKVVNGVQTRKECQWTQWWPRPKGVPEYRLNCSEPERVDAPVHHVPGPGPIVLNGAGAAASASVSGASASVSVVKSK